MMSAEGGATLHLLPDLGTFVQQAILFAVLAGVLYKFAWRHILHALDEREKRLHGDMARAEQARKEAEAIVARHQAELDKVKVEAQAILDEGKADAERLKGSILEEARGEAKAVGERALREIALARDKAVSDLQQEAAQLSIVMASKILGREVKPADQERLLQESLAEFRRQAMN